MVWVDYERSRLSAGSRTRVIKFHSGGGVMTYRTTVECSKALSVFDGVTRFGVWKEIMRCHSCGLCFTPDDLAPFFYIN